MISKSWLKERKAILGKIKEQVRLYLGEESVDIQRYAQKYKADLARPWQISDWQHVFVAIEQSQVVFGGDFHPYAQAQRAHLRMIRKLIKERPLLLAMECLFEEDQGWVDQLLSGQITEEVFLEQTQWQQGWGFPWEHYKPLFDFAKKNGIAIIGLNHKAKEGEAPSLEFRDQVAAKILRKHIKPLEDTLIYVLYGDLHVAREHLPEQLQKASRSQRVETTTLYLNSENIYFQLAEKQQENQVEVVCFTDREYCLLTSPPWVKWQSYLMYLEENFDVDLDVDDDEDWSFHVDHTDHVSNLVKMIAAALQVDVDLNAIEVYSMDDPQVLYAIEKIPQSIESQLAYQMVQSDRSFYIPQQGFAYLSKSTVNHAAHLAGQYVHASLNSRRQMLWSFPEQFVAYIWVEAMAFLLSKFVNPKRKAQTMSDMKKQLEAFDKEDCGREPLLLALDQKMLELLKIYANQDRVSVYSPREKSSYILAAKFIGEILGDRYFVLYEKQILGIDNIRELLNVDLSCEDFESFYYKQLKLVDDLESKG